MLGPEIKNVGVCALVPDQWSDTWQPRHHVLSRLARYFHVVWVSPAPEWRKILQQPWPGYSGEVEGFGLPGLRLYKPECWPPKFYKPHWLGRLALDIRVKRACRLLRVHGCEKIILYLWRPEFAAALASTAFDLTCYHIDDEYSFSEVEIPPDPDEITLIGKVDRVFIHSPGLLENLGSINANTTFIPNGVDYESYSEPCSEPVDLASIPRPRIGYTGRIKKELDWPLICELTRKNPQWSFVFVGPRAPHPGIGPVIEELSRQDNVHFLGSKSVTELHSYPQHFDVCIMPYALNDYSAQFIYPLKLHEYLASGSPVVGSRIRSLESFRGLVSLAVSPEEWSTAISDSLQVKEDEQRSIRQRTAKEHDWNVLVAKIAGIMAEAVGRTHFSRSFDKEESHCSTDADNSCLSR